MKALLAILLLLVTAFALGAGAKKPSVVSFSPEGSVREVSQVVAKFSEAMVAFGDPKLPTPFDVKCEAGGAGRWIDSKNWVWDFPKPLPGGVQCEFTLKSGLKTLAGNALEGKNRFAFSTGGPAILEGRPYEGGTGLHEEEVFAYQLSAEPDLASVEQLAFFTVQGIPEKVGIRLVTGSARRKLLKSMYLKDEPSVVAFQAKQRFPNEAVVKLVWSKGIKTKTQVPTDADQILEYRVRKPFHAEFSCERENAKAACTPIGQMSLSFSSSLSEDLARKVVLRGPTGKPFAQTKRDGEETTVVGWQGYFSEASEYVVELPPGIEDDSGRKLSNAAKFPLKVKTAKFPPLAKFAASFGILEAKDSPILPVTVRSIEEKVKVRALGAKAARIDPLKGDVLDWIRRVDTMERERSVLAGQPSESLAEIPLPRKHGTKAFEVVGIPFKEPGFYVVEIESANLGQALLGKTASVFVGASVLVTNLAVHFKWGSDASLAWVTTLDKGQVVPNAEIQVRDCEGTVLHTGKTDAKGALLITGLPKEAKRCENDRWHATNSGLLVTATLGNDTGLVHTSWENGIERWRFNLPTATRETASIASTVLARNLLRAGDTVHMKHVLRRSTSNGMIVPPEKDRPKTLLVVHQGSEQKYRIPLAWDGSGIAVSQWPIPKTAALGLYTMSLVSDDKQEYGGIYTGAFRVEEFRVPLLKGTIQPPSEALVGVREIPIDLSVAFLSGGAAGNLAVKLRSDVHKVGSTTFADFEDFVFANGALKEGKTRAQWELDEEEGTPRKALASAVELTLDKNGSVRTTIPNLSKMEVPFEVITEMEFRDPNGEVQTVGRRLPVYPSVKLVGIKLDSWAASKDKLKFYVAVADTSGKPVSGSSVSVELLEKKSLAHRKRILGGYYAYEHYEEVKKLGNVCEGRTDAKGILICESKSPVSGNVVLQARARDDSGMESVANRDAWIAGEGEWWFGAQDHDRMDVLPEKKRYEAGETAKFQVRMPFRQATALVTVEREGVLETYVREISGKEPAIEIPVKPGFAPNVFVSVLAVRGRAGEVQPTALVDLGRPAFKLGIAEIKVGWKPHELRVKLSADREVYRVREKAKLRVSVVTASGAPLPKGAEVAVAAVDEGLLELSPNPSWELLDAMMAARGIAVDTCTAQMHVVGKRHFGLKALPTGGGGGNQSTRELFDTLLLWKARVKLDREGNAEVEVPLNDSITGFRLVAVANAGPGLFGSGQTRIRTTQDLMIFSGIPPVAREGDVLGARVTLRNTTARPMQVDLAMKVEGASLNLKPLSVALAAGESKEEGWTVAIPQGVDSLKYEITATEKGGVTDRMRVKQVVSPAVPVRTFQATLQPLEGEAKVTVERPGEALAGAGAVVVTLKPTLVGSLAGVQRYMRAYPFHCLEQETSRAVATRDRKAWDKVVQKLPAYQDSDGLFKYFPLMTWGSDVLTTYVLAISHEAGWEIPEAILASARQGLTRFVEGSLRRDYGLPTMDLALRKVAALDALARVQQGNIEPKLLGSIAVEPNLWPTSAVLDWRNLLERVPSLPKRAARLEEAEKILRARIVLQGTSLNFSTEKNDGLWWLMVSADLNAVRALGSLATSAAWKDDLPRLARGAIARQKKGHWDLTTANAWGVLAVEKFASVFEKTPVSGKSEATLAEKSQAIDWKKAGEGKSLAFDWPSGKQDLLVKHAGAGKPWLFLQSLAALPLKKSVFAGYQIEKTVSPLDRKGSGWTRGDLARVKLKLTSQNDMTWVVVSDPIPSGSSILGNGLATQGEKKTGDVWPAYEERSFEAFRAYYEFVPRGEWTVEYTVRLNNAGKFELPTTRVEAMYQPEMFGELPNAGWEVAP